MAVGVKFDGGKPGMDLLPKDALWEISKVLDAGAAKYGRFNWRHGIEWSRVISAAMRHLTQFNEGEDCDPETGLSHLAHLGCNVVFLLTYLREHPELDDRYGKEAQKTERNGKHPKRKPKAQVRNKKSKEKIGKRTKKK